MTYLALGALVVAFLVLLFHEIRKIQIKDFKARYDFITQNEIKFLWYFLIILLVSGIFYSNTLLSDWIAPKGLLWFAVRIFISICTAILIYQLFDSIVRIYYVGKLEEKLKILRDRPRISPQGNIMRKMSESEEDAYLDAAQIAEEENKVGIHSFNYDVWVDEKTGFKLIEKYDETLHPVECPECGYVTLRITEEEISTPPTATEKGILTRHYKCTFCKYRERREINFSANP